VSAIGGIVRHRQAVVGTQHSASNSECVALAGFAFQHFFHTLPLFIGQAGWTVHLYFCCISTATVSNSKE
jgi:hypothetical protein